MLKIIAIGAEGCLDLAGVPWARRATSEEGAAFQESLPVELKTGFLVDGIGRPYWLWAIDIDHPDIPKQAKERASQVVRCVRLVP